MNVMPSGPLQEAANAASTFADTVDKGGFFPKQAFAAIKAAKLLGAMVPAEHGGGDASLHEVAEMCFTLGQACGSTGLIFAMHQIEVAMILAAPRGWYSTLLDKIASEQLLLASVTSEEGIGGSIRTSACALQPDLEHADWFMLIKNATTISYGEHADGLLITSRINDNAAASEQVISTVLKDQYRLERTSEWDTLGMRGTCSHGYIVTCAAPSTQILDMPFGEVAESVMLPVSHILWSSVWLGIATDALTRARAMLRFQARKSKEGSIPPGAARLAEAQGKLLALHALIKGSLLRYQRVLADFRNNGIKVPISLTTDMNSLKVAASETSLQVVDQAMMICGMAGYKNGTPYSVCRHLRDIHSARLMVNNDRISAGNASFLLAQRAPMVSF